MIEADIDRYGSLARASCLADYLEIMALRGLVCTFAQLEDMVSDQWPRLGQKIQLPDEDPGDIESTAEGARLCILERLDILGGKYPFQYEGHRISLRPNFSIHGSPYVAMLAIALTHAYRLDSSLTVQHLFEALVTDALRELGLTVANVGELSRTNNSAFEPTLVALSAAVGITMNPRAATHRVRANDAGIDVFAHVNWQDKRNGRWSLIGQVTVGSSDSWNQKIREPSSHTWQKLMGETSCPFVFLAVPHHVEKRTFAELAERTSHTILDRTRLAAIMQQQPGYLTPVVHTVLNADIQSTIF